MASWPCLMNASRTVPEYSQATRTRIGLVLVDDVDEAGAVGEGEDVGREGEAGEEGEEEFHWGGIRR